MLTNSETGVRMAELQSRLLQKRIRYRTILPKNYDISPASYPILYLLHGLFGSCDNWFELTDIRHNAAGKDLIIVLVEGENGWYSDSVTVENNKFESYFLEELLPEVENSFRVEKDRRMIAGLSMGGYGAFKFALKNENLFVFAGSMSGAFIAPQLSKQNCSEEFAELLPSIETAFGETENEFRTENDLFCLVEQIAPENISKLPFFYFDCGVEDSFLEINQKFAELLKNKNIPFEFKEIVGGHDWNYWKNQLIEILEMIETRFKS